MKRRLAFVLILIGCLLIASDFRERASAQNANEKLRIERLSALGRLWGAVKFFHPYTVSRDIDWDAALVATIPKVNAATSAEEYQAAINHLLSYLKDPNTNAVLSRPNPNANASPADARKTDSGPQPSLRWIGDDVAVISVSDFAPFVGSAAKVEDFRKLFNESAKARGLILDLRCAPGRENFAASYWFNSVFSQALPLLLDEDLPLAATRHRTHSGYATQTGQTSGGYYSGFVTTESEVITARGAKGSRKPMSILINSGTPSGHALFNALRTSGRAAVIQEGERAAESGVSAYPIRMGEDVTALVRTNETINSDGTVGFQPDLIIQKANGTETDQAMEAGLKAARGESIGTKNARPAPSTITARILDKTYRDMPYPAKEYRLLALFRFWNIINYFFPYKHLLDRPWEEVLPEFIPKLEAATDAVSYTLTVAEMVTQIHDTHGFMGSPVFTQYLGTHRPPVAVKYIEGQTVVTHILDDSARTAGVNIGDVVVAIDSEDIAARRDRFSRILAASTPQALQWRIHQVLLGGAEKSEIKLSLKGKDGNVKVVALTRAARQPQLERQTPVYRVLPEGYGYIDLDRLTVAQIDEAFEAIKDTPAVIFDMRGYPNGTAWSIAPRLTEKKVTTARFERMTPSSPDTDGESRLRFIQTSEPSPKWRYKGKVIVLINEEAISQAEHTCLFLEASANATFIGTPTNGANGDVTVMILPGSIGVNFTGHDVRHGDGRQLQRVGIQPHVRVEPTIEGIRQGRDEVLERAIEHLKGAKKGA
jgi:C-terminal processing protease CtpA/Prc